MAYYELKFFKNSVGKVLSFTVNNIEPNRIVPHTFKARLLEVHEDHILVDEFFIKAYESGESGYETREVKLMNGKFTLNSDEIPLDH